MDSSSRRIGVFLLASLAGTSSANRPADRAGGEAPPIDAKTIHRKVLCGYQGWFRCPGDGSGDGWRHWSRNLNGITPGSITFEMWPNLTGFEPSEQYAAPGFSNPDGTPAKLFSSANPATVRRHFDWMREYGIDGVFLQRFLVDLGRPSTDRVLAFVRDSASKTGRVFGVCYDLTGTPEREIYDRLATDWKHLVNDLKLTDDDRYLHQGGRPVVFIWGLYPDRFGPALAHRILDFFAEEGRFRATVIGGCPWDWRSEKNSEWARAYRRLDVISPWNVANYSTEGGVRHASTGTWRGDLTEAKAAGKAFLPIVYPGFAWSNLKGRAASADTIPRLGGEFFWRQFSEVSKLGIDMAYVAMFDEVDEGTAILKVRNDPPGQAQFATFEGLPTDWYLRLTGEGSRLLRGERTNPAGMPIRP